jgi:hypothetical protein
MSGGRWDYIEYRFTDVVEDMKRLINRNGKLKTPEEMKEEDWRGAEWYEKYPEDKYHHKYPDKVIEKFKEGIEIIEKAQIYIQRFDYLLSGDDGEGSFLERLEEELSKLKEE